MKRKIVFYKGYFREFFDAQEEKVKQKIDFVLDLIRSVDKIPEKFLKHMEGTEGLYEMRIKVGNNIFRIFCFFDEGNLVVTINGFQKKTDKTPKNEIVKAKKIKVEYFNSKLDEDAK